MHRPAKIRGARRSHDVVMLVRNHFTVDSRVEREASYLAACGLRVLVLAVWAQGLQRRESLLGFDLERLANGTLTDDERARVDRWVVAASTPRASRGPSLLHLLQVGATANYYGRALARILDTAPHTVHCHDLDTLVPGSVAAVLLGCRLIYDSHELWTERNHGLTGVRQRLDWIKYAAMEGVLTPYADCVIVPSDGIADVLWRRYHLPRRPLVLPNVPATANATSSAGVAEAVLAQAVPSGPRPNGHTARLSPQPSLRQALGGGAGPILLHLGIVDIHRGLEEAVEALRYLPHVRLALVGPARAYALQPVLECAHRAGVADRVHHLPAVPREQVVALAAGADVGLVGFKPVCQSHELALPNKFFEYVAAGIPVVVSDLPEMRYYTRTFRLGAVFDPNSPKDLARAVRDILEGRCQLANAAQRRVWAKRFSWETQRRKLLVAYPMVADAATDPDDVAQVLSAGAEYRSQRLGHSGSHE